MNTSRPRRLSSRSGIKNYFGDGFYCREFQEYLALKVSNMDISSKADEIKNVPVLLPIWGTILCANVGVGFNHYGLFSGFNWDQDLKIATPEKFVPFLLRIGLALGN